MTACAVWRVEIRVSVIAGHGMPEGFEDVADGFRHNGRLFWATTRCGRIGLSLSLCRWLAFSTCCARRIREAQLPTKSRKKEATKESARKRDAGLRKATIIKLDGSLVSGPRVGFQSRAEKGRPSDRVFNERRKQ